MTTDKRVDYDWGYMIWWLDSKIHEGPNISSAKMVIYSGATSEQHFHDNCHEFIIVNSGNIELMLDKKSKVLGINDTALVEPAAVHCVKNSSNNEAHLTIIYSSADRNYQLI